jgi:NCAIR mutase (PurE)-related protein
LFRLFSRVGHGGDVTSLAFVRKRRSQGRRAFDGPSQNSAAESEIVDKQQLESTLKLLLDGSTSMAEVIDQLIHSSLGERSGDAPPTNRTSESAMARTPEACVDLGRADRCGFPEVVYGQGKTPEAIVRVFEALSAAGQSCLATRVDLQQAAAVCERFPAALFNETAGTLRISPENIERQGRVAVVSAGTSDLPVAEEAADTARWMNCDVDLIVDVGVAGPQRLLSRVEQLRKADSIVVVAGMEGALPSVVAGHVSTPVFAVPTSVGYGANFGGVAALLSMLNSCAANVAVVNIDAGFKAAYLAGMVARASCTVS